MSSADPYKTLGVARDASEKDIQKAYRNLAKKHHPDLNPGNAAAEAKFKEISGAYTLLSDSEKRARFDKGEIDASGNEQAPQRRYYRDYASGGGPNAYANTEAAADFSNLDDILSGIFTRGRGQGANMRGADVRYRLDVEFLDAVNGAKRRLALPDGSTIDVNIPAGSRDGQVLRLTGKGAMGHGKGKPGDALIEIAVGPHPLFVRDGDDIRIDVPISLVEAVSGGKIRVPTPSGPVTLTLPKWSNTGKVMRLRGKGVPKPGGGAGDEYITFKVVLPEQSDSALDSFVSSWEAGKAHDPRRGMEV